MRRSLMGGMAGLVTLTLTGFAQPVAPGGEAQPPPIRIEDSLLTPTPEEAREIASLIDGLAEIDKPDFGLSSTLSGDAFAPIPESGEFKGGIIMINHGLKTSPGFTRLVELGPKSLPALLKAIDDRRPTKLTINHDTPFGVMWNGTEIAVYDATPREKKAAQSHPDLNKDELGGGLENHITKHVVTIGDVCFVAIGQIVNRPYHAIRYQPTACVVVNSPTTSKELAQVVHEVWGDDSQGRHLVDSLLADYSERGGEVACGAAMRLLYYFPSQTAETIAKRIDGLDVSHIPWPEGRDLWQKRVAAAGLESWDLTKAVAFSTHPRVVQAFIDLAKRTDEPADLLPVITDATMAKEPDLFLERALLVLKPRPPSGGPFVSQYDILIKMAHYLPERARPLFETYLSHDMLETKRAVCHALKNQDHSLPWAVDLLAPLLEDRTDTGWWYGNEPVRPTIRVCDEAADALTRHLAGAKFVMEGSHADLDQQIQAIRGLISESKR